MTRWGQDVALLEDVGTGPWEMMEHVTDLRRRMKAVENHWRHTPAFAEMVWHDMLEESTRLANFLVGELDTGIFNADSRRAIQESIASGENPDLKFIVFFGAIIQMLWHEGLHYTPGSPAGTHEYFGGLPQHVRRLGGRLRSRDGNGFCRDCNEFR